MLISYREGRLQQSLLYVVSTHINLNKLNNCLNLRSLVLMAKQDGAAFGKTSVVQLGFLSLLVLVDSTTSRNVTNTPVHNYRLTRRRRRLLYWVAGGVQRVF